VLKGKRGGNEGRETALKERALNGGEKKERRLERKVSPLWRQLTFLGTDLRASEWVV